MIKLALALVVSIQALLFIILILEMEDLIKFDDPFMVLLSKYGFKLLIFNKYYFRLLCLAGLLCFFNVAVETISFCKSESPFQVMWDYGPMFGIQVNGLNSILLLIFNKEKIIRIGYTKVVKNTKYFKSLSQKQEANLRFQGKITDYAYIYQFACSLGLVLTALLFDNTVPNEERYLYWAIFSHSNIPIISNRYFLYLHGMFLNFMEAHAFVMALYCFIYFTAHIRFGVFVLVEQIENMTKTMCRLGIDIVNVDEIQNHLKIELREIISQHAVLIRFHNVLQWFMSTPCTIYTSLVLFSASGIMIALLTNKLGMAIALLEFGNYLGIAFAGFYGQIYTDNFESIYESACEMVWYLWDEDNKKNYSVFLNLSAKPRRVYFMFSAIAVNHRLLIQCFQKIYGGASIFFTLTKKHKQF